MDDLADVLALIKSETRLSTNKFQFFVVEGFGHTERVQERKELVIPQITKTHSIVMRDDSIITRWWTCLECRTGNVCDDCKGSQQHRNHR